MFISRFERQAEVAERANSERKTVDRHGASTDGEELRGNYQYNPQGASIFLMWPRGFLSLRQQHEAQLFRVLTFAGAGAKTGSGIYFRFSRRKSREKTSLGAPSLIPRT